MGARMSHMLPILALLLGLGLPAGTAYGITYAWVGAHSSDWTDARNWRPQGVPSNGDSIYLAEGELSISPELTLADVTVSGGTLRGIFTVTRSMSWTGGTLVGIYSITRVAQLSVSGAEPKTLNSAKLDIQGTAVWTGGELRGGNSSVIQTSGTLDVQGAASLVYDFGGRPTLLNIGTLRLSNSGTLTLPNNGFQLINRGTVVAAEGRLLLTGGTHRFETGSRFTGEGGTHITGATVTAEGPQQYQGLVEFQAGVFQGESQITGSGFRWSGGELRGTHSIPSGSQVELTGEAAKQLNGAQLTNQGTLVWRGSGNLEGGNSARLRNEGLLLVQNDASLIHSYGGRPVLENLGTLRKEGATGETLFPEGSYALDNTGTLDLRSGTLHLAGGSHSLLGSSRVLGAGLLRLGGAGVKLNAILTVEGNIELAGGALTGAADDDEKAVLTGPGAFRWTGGEVRGAVTVAESSTLTLAGPETKRLNAAQLTNLGTLLWLDDGILDGGNSAAIDNHNLFVIRGSSRLAHAFGGRPVLRNGGTIRRESSSGATELSESSYQLQNAGILDIRSGVLLFSGSSHVLDDGTTVTGEGTLRIAGATVSLRGRHQYQGAVELVSGTVNGESTLTGSGFRWIGGEIQGRHTLAEGASMVLSGEADKTLNGGQLTLDGAVLWTGGNLRGGNSAVIVNSSNTGIFEMQHLGQLVHGFGGQPTLLNTGTLRISGSGALTFPGSSFILVNRGTLDTSQGSLLLAGGSHRFETGGRFTGEGGTHITGATVTAEGPQQYQGLVEFQAGVFQGESQITGSGFRWSGGELRGTHSIPSGSQVELTGEAAKQLNGAQLTNQGTLVWRGSGNLEGGNSARLRNEGLLLVQNDASLIHSYGGRPVLENLGTLRKEGATGETLFPEGSYALDNTGTLDLRSGTLHLVGGSHSLADGSQITGDGQVRVSGGTTSTGAATGSGTLVLAGGTLQANGVLSVANVHWTGGEIRGNLTLAEGVRARIAGDGAMTLNAAALTNAGEIDWVAGVINAGNSAQLLSTGLIRVSGSVGFVHGFGGRATFTNAGTLEASGTFQGSLTNTGVVRVHGPSGATPGLVISGDYTQQAAGTLDLPIPQTTQEAVGVLVVQGSALLNGALRLATTAEPPPIGTEVTLVRYGRSDGLFESVLGPVSAGSTRYSPVYGDTELSLQVREGGRYTLWTEVVSRESIRAGQPQTQYVYFGNRGDVDRYDCLLLIRVPPGTSIDVAGPALPKNRPPADSPYYRISHEDAQGTTVPIYLYWIPAGYTGVVRLTVTPRTQADGDLLRVSAALMMAPESEFTRTGQGMSYFFDVLAQELRKAYVEAARQVSGQQLPLRRQVPEDLAEYDTAGFWNEQVNNGNVQGIFDTGPVPGPYATAAGLFLNIAAGAAWTVALAGGPVTISAAVALSVIAGAWDIWGIISTSQSLQQIRNERDQRVLRPRDPNEKAGPQGIGEPHYLTGEEPLRYVIYFENVETVSAAAQQVVVTDPLDAAKLDLSTFALGPITFADKAVVPPVGAQEYQTTVDLRPEKDLIVGIHARLDRESGVATWRFTSLDPATMQPTEDPVLGFLNPNRNPPEGDGSVSFVVSPRKGLLTGTEIRNQASIVFDTNEPIATPVWANTLDFSPPSSRVEALPARTDSTAFEVKWSGTDEGAGIGDYTIYVSENGGPYTVWQRETTATSATFTGQVGKAYSFYSVARDLARNEEDRPLEPEATTTVGGSGPLPGDANLDGRLDVRDAILVLQGSIGLATLTPQQAAAADFNGDSRVDVRDVVSILRRIVGLD